MGDVEGGERMETVWRKSESARRGMETGRYGRVWRGTRCGQLLSGNEDCARFDINRQD